MQIDKRSNQIKTFSFSKEFTVIEYYVLRAVLALLGLLPYRMQLLFFEYLSRGFLACSRRYRTIVKTNLQIAFPELDAQKRAEIVRNSHKSLARFIVDLLRLETCSVEWYKEHIDFPNYELVKNALANKDGPGALCISGHYGSFEFLPPILTAFTGYDGKVIARELKNEHIDNYWNRKRSYLGTEVIPRSGGLRKIVKSLKKPHEFCGMLFDQNVTRNLATFVDWFGVPAATTVAVGYSAVHVNAPIFVIAITSEPNGRYKLHMEQLETDSILQDESLGRDEKIQALTQKASDIFTSFIRKQPEGWFWMHRRWKTRPNKDDPSLYDGKT